MYDRAQSISYEFKTVTSYPRETYSTTPEQIVLNNPISEDQWVQVTSWNIPIDKTMARFNIFWSAEESFCVLWHPYRYNHA